MTEPDKPQSFSDAFAEGMNIPCPKCSKPMMMSSNRCSACATEFSDEEVKANIASKKNDPTSCLILIAVCILIGGLLFGAVSSCSSSDGSESSTTGLTSAGEEYAWKEAAKEVVRAKLRDPGSAEFSGMIVYPETADKPAIICGYVNSRNGFGGMTGPQRFIAGGTVMIEEEFTDAQMAIAWTKFCN